MKKYISLAALVSAAAMSTTAYAAELTDIATMGTLAAAAKVPDGTTLAQAVDVSSCFTTGNTVYGFNGKQGLLGIENDALTTALSQTSGYLTVAAWVYAGSVSEEAIFSFGEQDTGAKFSFKDGKMQITTKGKVDTTTSLSGISTGKWTLVAWSLALDQSSTSGVYVNDNSLITGVNAGAWNVADAVFAIGSANATTGVTPEGSDTQVIRDGFDGLIANLTVFTSDSLATNDEIITAMKTAGAAPTVNATNTYTWSGGDSGVWDTSTANWLVGDSTSKVAYSNYIAAISTVNVVFDTATSVNINEAITAGSVTISEDTTFNVAETGSLTVSGGISGAGKLTKGGAGTLSLGTANSYAGGTKITGGTLEITNKAALGTGVITIESDATLKQNVAGNNGMDGATYKYILAGGTLHTAGGNTSEGCAQIGAGDAITLNANSTIQIDSNFGMIASSHAQNILNLNGKTLTKKGRGRFWLSNTKITAGTFEIAEGTVVLVRDGGGAEGKDLDGSDATFKIHAGKGQLDLTGQDACSLTVAGMTIVVSESYSETTKAAITEGVSLTVEGGPIKIEKADSFALENVVESSLSYYIVDENSTWDSEWTADDFSLEGDWGSWKIADYNNTSGLLTLTAIPEPSAFGLLAGLGALALVASRRRRK